MMRHAEEDLQRLRGAAARFSSLAADPTASELRAMVQEYEFKGLIDELDLSSMTHHREKDLIKVIDAYLLVSHSMTSLLPSLLNLRVLRFSWVDFDDDMWDVLEALPHLNGLSLEDCELTSVRAGQLSLTAFHCTTKARLFNDYCSTSPVIMKPPCLEVLTLDDAYCTKSILYSLNSSGTFEHLTHLAIIVAEEYSASFFAFLPSIPNLSHLRLSRCSTITQYPNSLPPDIIPQLTAFEGPCHVSHLFTTGRPVTSVKLLLLTETLYGEMNSFATVDETISMISQFSKSRASLHELSIDYLLPRLDLINPICQFHRHLRCLDIGLATSFEVGLEGDVVEPMDYNADGVDDSPDIELDDRGLPKQNPASLQGLVSWIAVGHTRLPANIEIFRIHYAHHEIDTPLSPARERGMVTRLSELYPLLREVYLGNFVWQKMKEGWITMRSMQKH
ncbi:hypothetical protein SERLA73DRAFT_80003 [Serpula lacrymans var. lacrymans S7.3]|uniref:F-box domain-containing protein n=1 Tax=Serpula lacrymans var. lacrymans (strain S7.3) TaxID=936435 RepID=F8QIC0_SERL3|nr:hypothetical protein SERLA73DRAFT_80003 [Serpula lacrymans var. lacrymans S7.3]